MRALALFAPVAVAAGWAFAGCAPANRDCDWALDPAYFGESNPPAQQIFISTPSGQTTSHPIFITTTLKNFGTRTFTLNGVTTKFSESTAACQLTAGPATLSVASVGPGDTPLRIDLTVTVAVTPDTTGSCGWLTEIDIDSSCGKFHGATANSLTAQIP
jgi:hypothetical protein